MSAPIMRELVEFRIPEREAAKSLPDSAGRVSVESVRVVRTELESPLAQRVRETEAAYRDEGRSFFLSWQIRRRYSDRELADADALQLIVTAIANPDGAEAGTRYDEASQCKYCGAMRTQQTELILDLSRLPKNADIMRTLNHELVVSSRLASELVGAELSGFVLRPVHHHASRRRAVDLEEVPAGRDLIDLGSERGLPYPSWDFFVWLNDATQDALWERAIEEMNALTSDSTPRRPGSWFQLASWNETVPIADETRFGVDPFDEDEAGRFRCPKGHVSGLNVLSELHAKPGAWRDAGFAVTREQVGWRIGSLLPAPLIVVSPRFHELLVAVGARGFAAEVVHVTE